MNETSHEQDDLLDEAARQLCSLPVDEQRLDDALAATRQALHEAMRANEGGAGPRTLHHQKWRQMMHNRMTKLAIAAAIAIAFVGVGSWLKVNNGKAGIAFADVMERICSARTVIYYMTVEEPSQTAKTMKVMHIPPNRDRVENPDGSVMIFDMTVRKSLVLIPATKTAMRADYTGGPQEAFTKDLFEELLKLRGQTGENLGQREIDGRQAIGFRARFAEWDWTVWVDPVTELPIRIEVPYDKTLGPGAKQVMHDFTFDAPLDESLLSLDPPPGYTLQTQQFKLPASKEQLLTDSLKICADFLDGQFPEKFDRDTMKKFDKHSMEKFFEKARLASPSKSPDEFQAEVTSLMGHLVAGLVFVQMLPADSDWHYAGAGVKLGQADVPICWWKPAGSTAYHVIFGDLSNRDMAKADLDRITTGKAPASAGGG